MRHNGRSLQARLRPWWKKARERGLLYWLIVLVLMGAGVWIGDLCEEHDVALGFRYWIYQTMLAMTPWKAHALHTAVVLVGDDDYYDRLGGHSPINRAYLADLVGAVAAASPEIIALDFDLQSAGPADDDDRKLIAAISEAARHHPVILPVTLETIAPFSYRRRPAVYSGHPFSTNVTTGYIEIFKDVRPIPVALHLADGRPQDSFSEAIVRRKFSPALEGFTNDEEQPFATYLPRDSFLIRQASEVLKRTDIGPSGSLYGKIVVIGGDWDKRSIQGGRIDDIATPVGSLPGSLVHANFVEALLGSRVYREANSHLALALELVMAGALAVLFALSAISFLRFAAFCLLAIVLGYVLLVNFGRYYDFYFPVLLIVGHAGFEEVKEMWLERHTARGERTP